ncbi:ABC transporter substrate-binding protein [Thermoactinospora rubra]|uniref:ABC transporter substrate-binding protein n=1 Tax=Thermoactinospora rubra TaxID=1088767 RepID=UPI000A0FF819|nr:ABC transporter substrate-binding protein [Thermoactinospora rubra]
MAWRACAVVLSLMSLVCGGLQARADPPPDTLTPGVLRIGTYFVNPPFEYIQDGARVGFEVDLMKEVAERLRLKPRFVDTRWETILQQMRDGRYDCIVGGITVTPAREKILAWSRPYMTTTLSIIVDTAKSPDIHGIDDLKDASVGVQAATTDYDVATRMRAEGRIVGVKVYPFARIKDAMSDLRAGRITAVMKVYPVARWFVRQTPGLRIVAQVPDAPQPLGIGFSKATPDLVTAVDRALAAIKRDGTYAELARKWDVP